MNRWEEVHRLRDQEHMSLSAIARRLCMSRNTVRRLLATEISPSNDRYHSRLLDPYTGAILALLEREPTMPATVVRRRLMNLGYEGGITILKEYLAKVRPRYIDSLVREGSLSSPARIERQETPPGTAGAMTRLRPSPRDDSDAAIILISSELEVVACNQVAERLLQKPMMDVLGKKCYREFERRDSLCPHCPGMVALATGEPCAADVTGTRPDGSEYMIRLTAYPIVGPDGRPVGFVEVDEDISEQKRCERLLELLKGFEAALSKTDSISSVARQALNSAFSLEGVDFGCAYVRDQTQQGEYRTIAQRGVSRDLIEAFTWQASDSLPRVVASGFPSVSSVLGGKSPAAMTLVPIMHEGSVIARLLVGSSIYAEFPSLTLAGLDALGKMASGALASLAARQVQKEIRSCLRDLLQFFPLPTWCVNDQLELVFWNQAAQRILGWKEEEVIHVPMQLSSSEEDDSLYSFLKLATATNNVSGHHFQCLNKQGKSLDVVLEVMPLPRVIEPRAAKPGCIVVAQVSETVASPCRLEQSAISSSEDLQISRAIGLSKQPRVLVVDHNDEQRLLLVEVLSELGLDVTDCKSMTTAMSLCGELAASSRRFDLVIGELLPQFGCGGLELAAFLKRLDPRIRVVLSADSAIAGMEAHGLAGSLRRPFVKDEVRLTMTGLLKLVSNNLASYL